MVHSCRRLLQHPPLSRTSWWTVLTPIKTVSLSWFKSDILLFLSYQRAFTHTVGLFSGRESVLEYVPLLHIQANTSVISACERDSPYRNLKSTSTYGAADALELDLHRKTGRVSKSMT